MGLDVVGKKSRKTKYFRSRGATSGPGADEVNEKSYNFP